jgi:signal transduction histidine kinase
VKAVSGIRASLESVQLGAAHHPVSQAVIESGRPLVVDDVDTDPRTAWVHDMDGWPRLGPAVFVPLGAGDQTAGVLVLAWAPERRHLSRELDPTLPARFAEQAALTLQLARAQADQRRLALLQDRDRIARDLHDVVIQRLFAVGLGLQGASRLASPELGGRLEQAVDELDDTIKDIRRTIFELGTTESSSDLRAEIARLVRRVAATLKLQPQLEMEGPVNALVAPDLAVDLLAVLSEALSNAVRHARPERIKVVVSVGRDLVLEVADDGDGVPDGVVESGLRNIRERAERRGGRCAIATGVDGRGTSVHWRVPLQE